MRVIEQKMLQAIKEAKNFKLSNTKVEFSLFSKGVFNVYLFGNIIGVGNIHTKKIKIYSCGWFTNTTKSRLNTLIKENICQQNFDWYLDEEPFKEGVECTLNI